MDFVNFMYDHILISSLALANILIFLIFLILIIRTRKKVSAMIHRYNKFMSGSNGENIDYLLEKSLNSLDQTKTDVIELQKRLSFAEDKLAKCIQKIGFVRYRAFENVGGDLSFTLALLDNNNSGIVISSIYSREGTSTYGKSVTEGSSPYQLSVEESKAIDYAIGIHDINKTESI